jgi:hypothetical protein
MFKYLVFVINEKLHPIFVVTFNFLQQTTFSPVIQKKKIKKKPLRTYNLH